MSDAQLHALVIGATERLLLLLGWDKTAQTHKKTDGKAAQAYTELKKAVHLRKSAATDQMFGNPDLKPMKSIHHIRKTTAVASEWTDTGTSAFDAAVTGTV